MTRLPTPPQDLRRGELLCSEPLAADAALVFIGRVRTPWTDRRDCPRQGRVDGPDCRLELFEPWRRALEGIEGHARLEVLYWLHESRRDLLLQNPARDGVLRGTFALRSPVRPNPIGTSRVVLRAVRSSELVVAGLDCVDGTPLLDVKPDRCAYTPLAASAAD